MIVQTVEKGYLFVDGKVAVVWKTPQPKYLKVGDAEVVFQCEHGISLTTVDEDKIPLLLGYRGGCCGKQQQMIFLATEVQYKHWKNGLGGRE